MKLQDHFLGKWAGIACAFLLAANLRFAVPEAQAQSTGGRPAPTEGTNTSSASSNATSPVIAPTPLAQPALPDSPGAVLLQAQAAQQLQLARSVVASKTRQSKGTRKPLGAAAAEAATTSGVAASAPAGAAIAPAKQRRVRSFLIKMGAVVGAGIAIGTVMALSSASPSRPPGSQ